MARAVWSGAISFGLVNVPVKAFTAVREHTVHFHQLEERTGARIRYEKVSEKTGKAVEGDAIVSGYELSPGRYVTVDPGELARLRPRTTKTIDVEDFVDLADVDPIFYDHTYWLAPDGPAADRAYRLLLAAMDESGKVGVGKVVMRTKQYLAAIRPVGKALALSTLRFADEVVASDDVVDLGRGDAPSPKERKMAVQLVRSLATSWKPERYHDTYTEQLHELIDAKAKGEELVAEEAPEQPSKVVDLMAALQASLDASKAGGGTKGRSAPTRRAPAKKGATKRSTKRAREEGAPAKRATRSSKAS